MLPKAVPNSLARRWRLTERYFLTDSFILNRSTPILMFTHAQHGASCFSCSAGCSCTTHEGHPSEALDAQELDGPMFLLQHRLRSGLLAISRKRVFAKFLSLPIEETPLASSVGDLNAISKNGASEKYSCKKLCQMEAGKQHSVEAHAIFRFGSDGGGFMSGQSHGASLARFMGEVQGRPYRREISRLDYTKGSDRLLYGARFDVSTEPRVHERQDV